MKFPLSIAIIANTAGVAALPDNVWQVVAASGFNAILILILLYYGRLELIAQRAALEAQRLSNEKSITELRRSQDRNTKMVTVALLQFAALVPGAKGLLQSIEEEIKQTERDDNKDT